MLSTKKLIIGLLCLFVLFFAYIFVFRNRILAYSIKSGDIRLQEMILKIGGNPNFEYDGRPIIHDAVKGQKAFEKTEILLKYGADPRKGTNNNTTALHIAAGIHDSSPIMRLLITNGADVNKNNDYGANPLLFALRQNYSENANFLLDNGSAVNSKDRDGQTPLFFALYYKDRTMAARLLSMGANCPGKECFGKSPMDYAKEIKDDRIVKAIEDLEKNK